MKRVSRYKESGRYKYIFNRFSRDGANNLTFQALDFGTTAPSVDNLPQTLTINSTSKLPTALYTGNNATTSSWAATVGLDMTVFNVGANTTPNQGSPLFGSENDDSVKFNAADFYYGPNNDFGNVSTEDYVVEIILKYQDDVFGCPFGKFLFNGGSFHGWSIECFSPSTFRLRQNAGAVNYTVQCTGNIDDSWYHYLAFVKRDGNAYLYRNGVQEDITDFSNLDGVDLTIAQPLSIGARTTGQFGANYATFNNNVAYCALWIQEDWIGVSPDTELDGIAAERFSRLTSTYPNIAKGTYVPETSSRTTEADLANLAYGEIDTTYSVGANWMRGKEFRDAKTDRDLDVVKSNSFPNSEDVTGAEWTAFLCTITSSTGVTFRGREVQGLIGTAVNNQHRITSDLAPSTAMTHIFTAWVKAGARSAIRLQSTNQAAADVWAQFKLDGTATEASLASAGVLNHAIEADEDGFYKCTFAYDGGTANHSHRLQPVDDAEVDDVTYTGDGSTVDVYIAQVQHDYSKTSTGRTLTDVYVKTTGTGRTLGELAQGYTCDPTEDDNLVYVGDDGNIEEVTGEGVVKCNFIVPASSLGGTDLYLFNIEDSKTASDYIYVSLDSTTGVPSLVTSATAGNAGSVTGTTNVCDGIKHSIAITYKENSLKLYVDGVQEGSEDTSVTIPDALDKIHIGEDNNGANQLNGTIWDFRVYKKIAGSPTN